MFRCVTNIVITQQGAGRSKVLTFDYVNEFTATDTWVDLTNQATVILPKNLYARDKFGKLFPLFGTNKNIGGFDAAPLFLRGDKISIRFGYRYFRNGNEVLDLPADNRNQPLYQFQGYITEVGSKKPMEFKCEDNMWKLKQIAVTPRVWSGSVENLIAELLAPYPEFKVNKLTTTTIGPIVLGNETIAQVLERLRKEAHIESYFRQNELRVGGLVYIESDAVERKFVFQQNIISDDLMYKRKDDIVLSAIVISEFEDFTGATTKDGQKKTKTKRIEILVYWDKALQEWRYKTKVKGVALPENVEGERRTIYLLNVRSEAKMFQDGIYELQKFFYTGYKGKFTTFGIPYVKQGDNVTIEDPVLPERNGKYKVRGVEYSGGVQGHRQTIILDYKIS
jgi:hypothetical protein